MPFVVRILLGLLLIVPITGTAQSIDSLKRKLKVVQTEENRIELLKEIASLLSQKRDTTAIAYYKQLITLAVSRNDKLLEAELYNSIGLSWFHTGNLSRSSEAYYKALEITDDNPAFYALKARLFNNLGWTYKKFNNSLKALEFYIQAEQYARLSNSDLIMANVLNNKGVTEKDLQRYTLALETLNESLRINRKIGNHQIERFNLNNIGVILIKLNRPNEAADTLMKVLTMNRTAGDTLEIINNLINLSTIYYNAKAYPKAAETLLNALTVVPEQQASTKQTLYRELTSVYVAQSNFKKSYDYLSRYVILNDSLNNLKYHEQTLELDARYHSILKDLDLEEAKKNLAEQRLYLTLIISAFGLLLLAALFLWRLFTLKRRNENMLILLNNEIEAQAEELLQSNQNMQAVNENLEALVNERTLVITEQSQRLLQFAYMNSHKIRGPIATMMGLIELLQNTTDPEYRALLLAHMKTSSHKLDEIVRETSAKLGQEGLTKTAL